MTDSKNVRVTGEMVVSFTVELPLENQHKPITCDDPVIEAALCALSDQVQVFLWGEHAAPAVVLLEVDESDVTIEEDERQN